MTVFVDIVCIQCGATKQQHKYSNKGKYCSIKCQKKHELESFVLRWKNGLESGISGAKGTSRHIRRYMMERCNEKCESCGWGERHPTDNKVPLELDHIDGCHANNSENNLRMLCPNCHSLTSTYKSRNNGKSTRIYKPE